MTTIGSLSVPLTLGEFRQRIETENIGQLDLDDWAGCGCMVDQ